MIQFDQDNQNCALSEITGIQQYKDPSKILEDLFINEDIGDVSNSLNLSAVLRNERIDKELNWTEFYEANPDFVPPAFIIFSEAYARKRTRPTIGYKLYNYIVDNDLGDVTDSLWAKNPNSGNYVRIYLWMVDAKGLKAWVKENYVGRDANE